MVMNRMTKSEPSMSRLKHETPSSTFAEQEAHRRAAVGEARGLERCELKEAGRDEHRAAEPGVEPRVHAGHHAGTYEANLYDRGRKRKRGPHREVAAEEDPGGVHGAFA